MKGKFLVIVLFLCTGFGFAQSIEEGKKHIYYERWESAEDHFRNLITSDPGNLEAYYWLTKVLFAKNDIEGAKNLQKQLNVFRATNSKEEVLPLNKVTSGELLLHEGKSQEAKVVFDKVLDETRNKKPEVLIAIAKAYLDVKSTEYPYILELLNKAEKRDKKNPEIFALRGDVYRRMNDGGKAVQAYMQALQKESGYAKASYNIGKIYLTQNNPEMYLKYFNQAITNDADYAPAYYDLFYYYYFRDVNTAKGFLDQYLSKSDSSLENDYLLTDFLYASSQPQQAIEKAKSLLDRQEEKADPRLLKLIAYSYEALGDSANALNYLQQYFAKEADSNYVAKDFELKAKLLTKFPGNEEEVIASLRRALEMDTSNAHKVEYASQLADLYKEQSDNSNQAKWLGIKYQLKEDPSNIDLYYWGVAHYSASEYLQADSIFSVYTEKYPEHLQGFYWRAKSNALLDSTMENGLAVPFYEKVIEMASSDTVENKSLLMQAYGYLGAYHANIKKDYEKALLNFSKILELEPDNADAVRYQQILQEWVKTGNQ